MSQPSSTTIHGNAVDDTAIPRARTSGGQSVPREPCPLPTTSAEPRPGPIAKVLDHVQAEAQRTRVSTVPLTTQVLCRECGIVSVCLLLFLSVRVQLCNSIHHPSLTSPATMALRTQRNNKMLASLRPGNTALGAWGAARAGSSSRHHRKAVTPCSRRCCTSSKGSHGAQPISRPTPHRPPPRRSRRMAEQCGMTISVSEQQQHHDVHCAPHHADVHARPARVRGTRCYSVARIVPLDAPAGEHTTDQAPGQPALTPILQQDPVCTPSIPPGPIPSQERHGMSTARTG